MTTEPSPLLENDGQREVLMRLSACLKVARECAPNLSIKTFQVLVHLALETLDSAGLTIPSNASISDLLDLKPSTTTRIIASLSRSGRDTSEEATKEKGYGLIETNDWVGGLRIQAYVLTPKGRECIMKMMVALSGQEIGHYRPHDLDSLFKHIFTSLGKK